MDVLILIIMSFI